MDYSWAFIDDTETTPQPWTPDWSQNTPAALLLAFIAVAAYLFNKQQPEEEQ